MSNAEQTDVVVIGAGIGGLRAATLLVEAELVEAELVDPELADLEVIVLEARDRVGGRLWSPEMGGDRLDGGATWFWPNERRINALLAELGAGAYPQHMAGQMIFQEGPGPVRRMPNQLDVPSGRVVGGLASVAEKLASRLSDTQLRLGTTATSVGRGPAGLRVETTRGVIDAAHVVMALPPALAVSAISMGDDLDAAVASVAAATPVWMGSTVKVVVTYHEPFWRDEGLAGSAFSYVGPMRELHDMSGPDGRPAAIFGFCATGPSEAAPSRDAVIEQMTSLFGPSAADPTDVHVIDWRAEPHTVPPSAVGLTNYQTYGHDAYQTPAMSGRLHWSSTETSVEMPGHVEGALAAAERAARAILTYPTDLSAQDSASKEHPA